MVPVSPGTSASRLEPKIVYLGSASQAFLMRLVRLLCPEPRVKIPPSLEDEDFAQLAKWPNELCGDTSHASILLRQDV